MRDAFWMAIGVPLWLSLCATLFSCSVHQIVKMVSLVSLEGCIKTENYNTTFDYSVGTHDI